MVTAGDFIGNLDEMLVVQRFNDVDQQRGIAGLDGAVEFAHVTQTDDFVEVDVVGKRLEQFGLRFPIHYLVLLRAVRTQQEHSPLVGYQVKHLEHACRSHQRPVETVDDIAQFVVNRVQLVDAFQQPHLVLQALFAEHLDDVSRQALAAHKRDIGSDDFFHALLELCDDFGREEFHLMLDLAIMSVADAVLDAQALAGIQVVQGFVQHHAQRPRQRAISGIAGDVDELDVFG